MSRGMWLRARSRTLDGATVGVLCAALLVTGAGGASAAPSDEQKAEATSELISDLAPGVEVLDVREDASGDHVAHSDSAQITIPSDLSGGVVIAPAQGAGNSVVGDVTFDLPGAGA